MAAPIITFESGWSKIKPKISKFLDNVENGMTHDSYKIPVAEYVATYNVIFDMSIQRDPYNWSALLYEKYCSEITAYTSSYAVLALEQKKSQNSIIFLREWPVRFENHTLLQKGLADMFTYLDRYFTPANLETCLPLRLKGWRLYKSLVFDNFKSSARDAVLALIQREREGDPQDSILLKSAVGVFIEMGFKIFKENCIATYKEEFQTSLIAETREFYKGKAKSWLSQDSCPDYMIKAEKAVLAEEARLADYLHPTSVAPLLDTVLAELIEGPLDELLCKDTGIEYLLDKRNPEDLRRLFFLINHRGIISLQERVAAKLREYVRKLGHEIVEKEKKSESKEGEESHSFVKQLMNLHEQFRNIVRDCFRDAQLFQKGLQEAFEDFINQESTVSKLLARFVNDSLKKGSKVDQNEIDGTLANVVMLYGYIREKDTFEREYQTHLSHRLLNGTSQSEHSEKSMIAKLKTECGYQWTSKLEGMFKDVQLSKDMGLEFSMKFGFNFSTELDVNICTTGYWPVGSVVQCRQPPELQPLCSKFKDFYLNSHNGRKLDWRFDIGQAEVKIRFNDNLDSSKELSVSCYMMLVLLLFNHHEVLTTKQICEATNISLEVLNAHILSLAHPKSKVLLKHPNTPKLEDADVFRLNDKFSSKTYRTKIALIKTKEEVKVEEEERQIEIETLRKHQIDAALVRVMKARRVLAHNSLISEVVQQLSARFSPEMAMIKSRIAQLIEQDYLERDPSNHATYRYLA